MPRPLPLGPVLAATLTLAASSSSIAQDEAEAAGEVRPRLLVLDLASNGVEEDIVKTISGVLAVELSSYQALDVLTSDDIRRTLELEAQRHSAGCDDASCLSELAGALGADLVIYGDVGQLGSLLVVNLSLFDTSALRSIGRVSARAETLESVPGELRPKLADLLTPWYDARGLTLERPLPAASVSEDEPPVLPWVVAGGGGALVVGGGVLVAVGAMPWLAFEDQTSTLAELEAQGPSTLAEAKTAFAAQEQAQRDWDGWGAPAVVAGVVAVSVGAAAVVGGIAWGLLSLEQGAAE